VGSEGYLPNTGWPYAHLLKRLRRRDPAEMTPENLARWTVADVLSYYDQCIPAWVSVDMAALRLDRLRDLAKRLRTLTAFLRDRNDHPRSPLSRRIRDSVIVAHWRAQSYKFEQYTDLWDFCDQLEQATRLNGRSRTLRNLEGACRDVKAAVDAVVVQSGHRGAEFQHSHGLSVYFPWSPSLNEHDDALADYRRLGFPKQSGWNAFLKSYLKSTQREMREEGNGRGDRVRLSAFGTPEADSANKASERVNKASERVNKASERVNKFGDLIMRLYAGPGMAVPWSMKNPPRSGWWTKPVARA